MDDQAAVVQGGYYTIVISDDLLIPNWLQPNVNWLPWGDEQYPKLVFMRNMVPVTRNDTNYTTAEVPFPYAIQWVVQGCPGTAYIKMPSSILLYLMFRPGQRLLLPGRA